MPYRPKHYALVTPHAATLDIHDPRLHSCVTVSTKELQAHNSAVSADSSDHTNYFLKTPLNTKKSK